ncbi:MAG: 50S ribosomal protein L29 [Rickettsiaceae bacterium]
MSKIKIKSEEVSGLSVAKLKEKVVLLKKELFNLRFQKTLGELKNTSTFLRVRRDIARVKTELTKRKTEESK